MKHDLYFSQKVIMDRDDYVSNIKQFFENSHHRISINSSTNFSVSVLLIGTLKIVRQNPSNFHKKKKYEKYERNIGRRTLKNSGSSSRRGGGENLTDTIPGMAPSTEREGVSPAKKILLIHKF